MATTEIKTGAYGHQFTEAKPEHVVEEFDNGKTVRCADRSLWQFDPKAKVWHRVYTVGFNDYLRYNGGARKPRRNLPDEAYEITPEHQAARDAKQAARNAVQEIRHEHSIAQRRAAMLEMKDTPAQERAHAQRMVTAIAHRLEEAEATFHDARRAELYHERVRTNRLRAAEMEKQAEARKRREEARAQQQQRTDAEAREFARGAK